MVTSKHQSSDQQSEEAGSKAEYVANLRKLRRRAVKHNQRSAVEVLDGRIAFTCGSLEKAAEHFGAALEADINNDEAYWGRAACFCELGQSDKAVQALRAVVERFAGSDDSTVQLKTAAAMICLGEILGATNRIGEQLQVYDELVERFGTHSAPGLPERVAKAALYKGMALDRLGSPFQAIAVYDDLANRHKGSGDLPVQRQVARALVHKGVTLTGKGLTDDALASFKSVLETFGESDDPDLQVELAVSLFNTAYIVELLGDHEHALHLYEQVIQTYGTSVDAKMMVEVAKSAVNKANLLHRLDRSTDSLAACEYVAERFADAISPNIQEQIAMAIMRKALIFEDQSDYEIAIASYEEVWTRYHDSESLSILTWVVKAGVWKSHALRAMGRTEEALASYRQLIQEFEDRADPLVRHQVAIALMGAASVLRQSDRLLEAKFTYQQLIDSCGDCDSESVRVEVARALLSKGDVELNLGWQVDEIPWHEGLRSVFPPLTADTTPESILVVDDHRFDAIASYDQLIDTFGSSSSGQIRDLVVGAFLNKGVALARLRLYEDELKLYDDFISRFGGSDARAYACCQTNRAGALVAIGHYKQAVDLCDEVTTYVADHPDACLQEWSIRAAWHKGEALEQLEQFVAAKHAYEEVLSHQELAESDMRELVDFAATALIRIEGNTGDAHNAHQYKRIQDLLGKFGEDESAVFQRMLRERRQQRMRFLSPQSRLKQEFPFLLTLRKWNSFTPIIPDRTGNSRGGGYYVQLHDGEDWKGVVIDPGHDFIDNFSRYGGLISDIDYVVITHSHGDHTSDLESICTLLYEYNDQPLAEVLAGDDYADSSQNVGDVPGLRKQIGVYANLGTTRKFAEILELRPNRYLEKVRALNPGDRHPLMPGVDLYVLPAYHDEIRSHGYSVGLLFDLKPSAFGGQGGRSRQILFTGDTSYYPRADDGNGVNTTARPITALYRTTLEEHGHSASLVRHPDVLIAHMGSIYPGELAKSPTHIRQRYYPNHLGVNGTMQLIVDLAPRLALVSEFDEDMAAIRPKVLKAIAEVCAIQSEPAGHASTLRVLPADMPLIYDIRDRKVFCTDTWQMESYKNVDFFQHGDTIYYRKTGANDISEGESASAFEEELDLLERPSSQSRLPHIAEEPRLRKRIV